MPSSPGRLSESITRSISPFSFYYDPNDGPGLLDYDLDIDSSGEDSVEVLDGPENTQFHSKAVGKEEEAVESESDGNSTDSQGEHTTVHHIPLLG
jgi:hypothetical protein